MSWPDIRFNAHHALAPRSASAATTASRDDVSLNARGAEEDFYRLVFEQSPSPLWFYDSCSLRLVEVNNAALTQYGYTRAEFLSQSMLDLCVPEDRDRLQVALHAIPHPVARNLPTRLGIWQHRTKSGALLAIELVSAPLAFPTNDSELASRRKNTRVVFATDVTACVLAEEREKHLVAEMAEAVHRQRRFIQEVLFNVTEGRLRICDSEVELPCRAADTVAPGSRPIRLATETLSGFRGEILAAAGQAGLSLSRAGDLMLGAGEAAMNAVVHGGGGVGTVYTDPESGLVQVWIADQGRGIQEDLLHRATLERGWSTTGTQGQGFWMMLQSCDRIWLLTSPNGTTVVLEQDLHPVDRDIPAG